MPGPDRAAQLALERVRSSSGRSSPIDANAIRSRRSAPVHGVSRPSASSTGIGGGAGRRDRACAPQHRALGAVDDVALGDAHVPGEDELLLDDVLDGLDRHVRGARARRARSPTRAAIAAAGSESSASERNALRIAGSIFAVLHGDDLARAADQARPRAARAPASVGSARRRTSALATSNVARQRSAPPRRAPRGRAR